MYLARENRYWAQLMLRPISALPCQINQISDSSRPKNCIVFVGYHDVVLNAIAKKIELKNLLLPSVNCN